MPSSPLLVVLSTLVVIGHTFPALDSQYAQWAAEFNKTVDPAREAIFMRNAAFVRAHDATRSGFRVALNRFADLSVAEFVAVAMHQPKLLSLSAIEPHNRTEPWSAEDEVDWRTKGKVTAVHDSAAQGCSTPDVMADAVSSSEAILCAGASLTPLSSQQLLDCATAEVCAGTQERFSDYIIKHGILSAQAYAKLPGAPGKCRVPATIKSTLPCNVEKWAMVPAEDNDALKVAVAGRPVMVSVNAASSAFQFYKDGVLSADCGAPHVNHALVAVGYGKDYWILKNSWGVNWGDRGYIKLLRQTGTGAGECGVATYASYPVLK